MKDGTRADPAAAGPSEQGAYEELQCYTLAHGDGAFLHQHVVDAWTAQHANEETRPIALTFALVGLFLRVECGFSGRQVQRAHMALARHRRSWPTLSLPPGRGTVTAGEVAGAPAGLERDRTIDAWCASVWDAFRESREAISRLLEQHGIGPTAASASAMTLKRAAGREPRRAFRAAKRQDR